MTGSTKLVSTLGLLAVVATMIGLAAGNASTVSGAPARSTSVLLSTVEEGTASESGNTLLAGADLEDAQSAGNTATAEGAERKDDAAETRDVPEDVSISGVIRVRGEVPDLPPLVVAGDRNVRNASILTEDVPDESLLVGAENGLANVFVWLRNVPDGMPIPSPPSEPLVLASSGLRYVPHAAISRTGQPLRLTNADPVASNVHTLPRLNASLNQLIAARDLEGVRFEFDRPERQPVRMVDDFHPTRVGYVLPLDHPFADLTDTSGRFNIRELPTGEYELSIWHERAGYLERDLPVTVPEDGSAELDLEYDVEQFLNR